MASILSLVEMLFFLNAKDNVVLITSHKTIEKITRIYANNRKSLNGYYNFNTHLFGAYLSQSA